MKLTQDNRDKLSVEINSSDLEYYAKRFFNWKTATKNYKNITDRFMNLGSYKHDKFISYLHGLGF